MIGDCHCIQLASSQGSLEGLSTRLCIAYQVHPYYDCGFLPNRLGSMILMVVVATESVDDVPSIQFTTVPFSPLFTVLTTDLDTNGELFWPESLEKVIMELLIVSGGVTPLVPADVRAAVWVVFSCKTVNSHRWTIPDEVHLSSSWSPAWQTEATAEGESSTTPAHRYIILSYIIY